MAIASSRVDSHGGFSVLHSNSTLTSFYMKRFLTLTVALCCASAFAQENSLPTIVVTAEPSLTAPSLEQAGMKLAEVPGGASVVDAQNYKQGRAANLKDALDFAPGVYVQPRFGAEESRISIRGSGLQRTFHGRGLKLLQDGVPLNLADGGFDFQAVEPLATRYIEVYRGANALEFGATTLGGAINFVSATGHEAAPISARFETGSFDTYHAQLSSGAVSGPLDYYLSLSHFSTDGFREHSQQNTQRLFANVGCRLAPEWETRFYVTCVQSDSELPGAITKAQLESDPRQAQRNPYFAPTDVVLSNWKRDFELLRLANKTTWQSGDQRLSLTSFWAHKDLDHPILFWIDQLSNDFGLDLRYENSSELLGLRNEITVGMAPTWGYMQDNRFANNRGNRGKPLQPSPFGASAPNASSQSALNFDLYAQERLYFLPEWAVVLGSQLSHASRDNNDEFPVSANNPDNSDRQQWWGWSPKIGLLWEITQQSQAFMNVSRSFEPPSFGELVNATGGGLVELDAQRATTFELGTRGASGPLSWDMAFYHAWLDDELLQYELAPGFSQTINAGRTIHQGIEGALEIDLLKGLLQKDAGSLLLRQIYLWNDFRFDGDPVFGDNRLAGIPEHYFRTELLYEHPCGFYAGPNMEWSPKKYSVDFAQTLHADPYALLGFKIGWKSRSGVSIFAEARNLTDKAYAATTNVIANAGGADSQQFYPGDGRAFYGGMEWKW